MSEIFIGMLVGMGPNSTGRFYDRVMQYARELYGAAFDADFPRIALISQPTPFYVDRQISDEAMISSILHGLAELKKLNVDLIVIPCNVAHLYMRRIKDFIEPITFLNMVELTLSNLTLTGAKSVALVSTAATASSRIYHDPLAKMGIDIVHDDDIQNTVNRLIAELKIARLSVQAACLWRELVEKIRASDCSQAILACTDLTPCLSLGHTGLTIIDAGDTLARATVTEYMKKAGIVAHPMSPQAVD